MAQQDTLGIFTGGQMTDLPEFTGTSFDGTELFEVVAPGSAALGINYRITSQQLATLLQLLVGGAPTFVINEAVYNSVPTDTRILVDNTAPQSTSIVLDASADYSFPVLVKDLDGLASDTDPITVTFSGGELMDGLSQVVINNPYGYMWFNPLAAGGWYDAS